MQQLIKEVKDLVGNEYTRASAQWGFFNSSDHESFAVLKEEVEEASDEAAIVDAAMNELWLKVKRSSDPDEKVKCLNTIQLHCVLQACESIQAAAMAHKAIMSILAVPRNKNLRG